MTQGSSRRKIGGGGLLPSSSWWLLLMFWWRWSLSVSWIILLLWIPGFNTTTTTTGGGVIQQQAFRRTPDNQTATIGDRVTLACSVINKVGVLQWTRDGFGLGTDRRLEGYDRYSMVGSEEEGEYTLVIEGVTLEDDAVFQCQVGPGPGSIVPLISPNAKLTVEVETGPPQILQGPILTTTEDRQIQLECVSFGGKPPAEITWIDGAGQELKSNVVNTKQLLEDGKRYNSRSILTLIPKKEHHNQTFSCQAANHPAKEVKTSFIRLQVKYAPKITLKIHYSTTQHQQLKEFDNIKISCEADGNPPEMIYAWFLNDAVIVGHYGSILSLVNVSRTSHRAIVKCQVTNSIGSSQASQILDISYGPKFRARPQSVQADFGASATLSCDVDGNPTPEIVWFHELTRVAVSTKPNLTVTVAPETSGPYICQAVVQGYPEISATASIMLKGPPMHYGTRVQFGLVDEPTRIECLAKSIPRPEKVEWSHFGRSIDVDDDPNYNIIEDPMPDGVKSTLIIKTTTDKDFGLYNCSVTNQYGTRSMEIFLKRQEHGQIFITIALTCVIGGVVLIVAIALICLLCQTKPKNSDGMERQDAFDETQANKSDDVSSNNDSDLKVEIRTSSSCSNMQEEEDSEHPWGDETMTSADALKNESLYQYSNYIDPIFFSSSKADGHTNNNNNSGGYIPYVDYARDYNPPTMTYNNRNIEETSFPAYLNKDAADLTTSPYNQNPPLPQYLNSSSIDLCYSATYGNTYLSSSFNHNPLPAPPHYSRQLAANNQSHHSPPPPQSESMKPNNYSINLNQFPNNNHNNMSSSSSSNNLRSNSNSNLLGSGGGGAGPQVPPKSPPSQFQYIIPSQQQQSSKLKPGTLATHV